MLAVEMLSEAPIPAQDIYVTDLAAIETTSDGMYRLYFITEQASHHGGGKDFVISCRMIAGPGAMLRGAKLVLQTLGYACCGAAKRLMH